MVLLIGNHTFWYAAKRDIGGMLRTKVEKVFHQNTFNANTKKHLNPNLFDTEVEKIENTTITTLYSSLNKTKEMLNTRYLCTLEENEVATILFHSNPQFRNTIKTTIQNTNIQAEGTPHGAIKWTCKKLLLCMYPALKDGGTKKISIWWKEIEWKRKHLYPGSIEGIKECTQEINHWYNKIQTSEDHHNTLEQDTKGKEIFWNNSTKDSSYDILKDIETITTLMFQDSVKPKELIFYKMYDPTWWEVGRVQDTMWTWWEETETPDTTENEDNQTTEDTRPARDRTDLHREQKTQTKKTANNTILKAIKTIQWQQKKKTTPINVETVVQKIKKQNDNHNIASTKYEEIGNICTPATTTPPLSEILKEKQAKKQKENKQKKDNKDLPVSQQRKQRYTQKNNNIKKLFSNKTKKATKEKEDKPRWGDRPRGGTEWNTTNNTTNNENNTTNSNSETTTTNSTPSIDSPEDTKTMLTCIKKCKDSKKKAGEKAVCIARCTCKEYESSLGKKLSWTIGENIPWMDSMFKIKVCMVPPEEIEIPKKITVYSIDSIISAIRDILIDLERAEKNPQNKPTESMETSTKYLNMNGQAIIGVEVIVGNTNKKPSPKIEKEKIKTYAKTVAQQSFWITAPEDDNQKNKYAVMVNLAEIKAKQQGYTSQKEKENIMKRYKKNSESTDQDLINIQSIQAFKQTQIEVIENFLTENVKLRNATYERMGEFYDTITVLSNK